MLSPSGVLSIVCLPIVTASTILFWYFRKKFPIADRAPWMGITVGGLVMVADIMQLNASLQPDPPNLDDKACSIPLLTIHTFLIPYGICTFVLRTWLLLFRYEITADLQGRNGGVLQSVSIPSSSQPSLLSHHGLRQPKLGGSSIANGGIVQNSGAVGQPRYQPFIGHAIHQQGGKDDVMVSVSRPSQPAAIISTIGMPSLVGSGNGNNNGNHNGNGTINTGNSPLPPLSPGHLAPSTLPLFTSSTSLPSSASPLPTPSATAALNATNNNNIIITNTTQPNAISNSTSTTILMTQRLPVLRPSSGSHGGTTNTNSPHHYHHHIKPMDKDKDAYTISTPISLDGTSAANGAFGSMPLSAPVMTIQTSNASSNGAVPAATTTNNTSRPSTAQPGTRAPIVATSATLGAAAASPFHADHLVKNGGVMVNAAPYEKKVTRISWYTRNHWVMRSKSMIAMVSSMLAICIIITIVIRMGEGDAPCRDRSNWLYAQYGVVCVFCLGGAVPILILAMKLSKFGRDNLGMKRELGSISVFIVVFGCVMVPLVVLYGSDRDKDEMLITGILVWGNLVWTPIELYPLYLAFCHWRRQLRLVNDVQRSSGLADFLKHAEAARSFMEFVSREFNSESLVFYTQATAFASRGLRNADMANGASLADNFTVGASAPAAVASKPTLALPPPSGAASIAVKPPIQSMASVALKEAWAIHRAFVVANSPFEVNLSHTTRKKIQTHLQTMTTAAAAAARDRNTSHYSHGPVSPNGGNNTNNNNGNGGGGGHAREADALLVKSIRSTYDEAIVEILKLMSANSFSRYRASSAYKQLIETLQQQDQPRAAWTENSSPQPIIALL